jgi:hypothetical protein
LKNFSSSITHQVVGFHEQKHHEQISWDKIRLMFHPERRSGRVASGQEAKWKNTPY